MPATERLRSVLRATLTMGVAMLDFFGCCRAHIHDIQREVQALAGHRVVQVDIDHRHANLQHGHGTRTHLGAQHHLHARHQPRFAEMLLGHALGETIAALAIGLLRGHSDFETVTRFMTNQGRFDPGNDIAMADQNGHRLATLGAFQLRLTHFRHRVVEPDNLVFFDFHDVSVTADDAAMTMGHTRREQVHKARERGMVASDRPASRDRHYPGQREPIPAMSWRAAALALALLLGACASSPPAPLVATPAYRPDPPPADPLRANDVLLRALGLVGVPYRWGGNSPEGGFDCSGLVTFVFNDAAGIRLPRTTREIANLPAQEPSKKRLAAGDLVLFGTDQGANHVGIYVGEGRFVHAPNEGGTVRLDRLDDYYWRDTYLGAKRVLP